MRLDLFCNRNCFKCNHLRIQGCIVNTYIDGKRLHFVKNIYIPRNRYHDQNLPSKELISFIYFLCLENLHKDMILKYLNNKHHVKMFIWIWTWLDCDHVMCNPKGFLENLISYQQVTYLDDLLKMAAYCISVWESQLV